MEKILQSLEQIPDWIQRFQFYVMKNNLSNNLVSRLQSHNIESLNKHLLKLSQENRQRHKISWVSSQYQVLEIVLNSISTINEKIIEEFNFAQWQQVYAIFPYKVHLTIKYESLRIVMEKKQPRRRWIAQQENFLIEIVKGFTKKNKWNDVARQLFIKSDGEFFRQGKHCRERWLNHLHPSIENNGWATYEDLQLLNFVLKKGKKWARIAKKFEMKRSECMVKKRFFELIKTEQQDGLLMETLKSLIRNALQEIRSQMSEKREEQKSGAINQQFVDMTYKMSSISKDKFKTQEKQFQGEKKSSQTRGKSEAFDAAEDDKKEGFQQQREMHVVSCQPEIFNYAQCQNPLGYCLDYFGYMNSMFNSMYPGCQQFVVPIQNNIFFNPFGQQNVQQNNY